MGASSPVSFFSLSDIIQRIYRNVEKRKKERKKNDKQASINRIHRNETPSTFLRSSRYLRL